MSFVRTMNPNGGVGYRRVMKEPFPNDHLLERILSTENIRSAWKQVRANKGAPGTDGVTVDQFPDIFLAFKRRLRRLTGRSWFVSMEYRYEKLAEYVRGWMNYYGISEYYRPIPLIDEWFRRRTRMCYWKQWRYTRTKVRNLLKLGAFKREAIMTSPGYGPADLMNRPVRTRLWGGMGAGGLQPPATRLEIGINPRY